MKKAIKKQPLEKVRYVVEPRDGGYDIVMMVGNSRRLIGSTSTPETAEQAVRKLVAIEADADHDREILKRRQRKNLERIKPAMIQIAAMTIDPERAWRFREAVMMLNYTLHMLTLSFDEVESTWNKLVAPNVRQRLSQVMRGVDRVLDDILASQIAGDATDYGNVIDAAHGIHERMNLIVNYAYRGKEDTGWRMRAIDECLEQVFPDEWIAEQRNDISRELIAAITRKTEQQNN